MSTKQQSGPDKGNQSGGKSNRGFASMDAETQRQIASEGGRAAHEKGTAHEFDSAEAREAGRKGGEHSHGKGTKQSGEQQRSGGAIRGDGSEQPSEAGRQGHKNR